MPVLFFSFIARKQSYAGCGIFCDRNLGTLKVILSQVDERLRIGRCVVIKIKDISQEMRFYVALIITRPAVKPITLLVCDNGNDC
ncbi:hypothetical protein SAMN04487830_11748 [Pseudobutyrivibrio sp. OR37]|nr:hypothetical protein SAMN04487830_11748 [Pseudobutyrivibrio sp. OR37]